jgi:hypothetical protein
MTDGPVFSGLRGNGLARCAGLWSNLLISNRSEMDQLVSFSSCSKFFCCKPGSFSGLKL